MTPEEHVPLSRERLDRIRQWRFNGTSSAAVTSMRDDLLATIAARDERIEKLERGIREAAEYLSQSFFTREELAFAERLRALLVQP